MIIEDISRYLYQIEIDDFIHLSLFFIFFNDFLIIEKCVEFRQIKQRFIFNESIH